MTRLSLGLDSISLKCFNNMKTVCSRVKTMLFLTKTVLKENHVQIEKVRASSSQFSYTVVMMNMKLPEVVKPPSIYHCFSSQKTFWEERFTCEKKLSSAVKMKNGGLCNVRKQEEIMGCDMYVTLDISLKFDSMDKMKITSSESKGKLEISVKR